MPLQIYPPCMICPDHIGIEWQGGNLHHSPVSPCAPSCSAHHSAPRVGLPAPVLRCHPYNLSLSGEKVQTQSWIPRRLVKLGTLFMLQSGRTKINGMFYKALCCKKRFSFSIYYIFSLLFCHYIYLLHYFSVSIKMVSFHIWTLSCFLWVADFSLFNCGWDWSFAFHFPDLPFCKSHSNSVKTDGVTSGLQCCNQQNLTFPLI